MSKTATTPMATVSRYTISKATFQHNYQLTSESSSSQKYVRIRTDFTAPGLTLHDGPDDTGPVQAVVYGIKSSSSFKIGLGDPNGADNVIWEHVHHDNAIKTKFTFEMEIDGVRKAFTWKRTRTETVDGGDILRWSILNWKLVAEDEILAVFTSDKVVGIKGVLQVNVDYGEAFATMVLVTTVALIERQRRSGG